MNLKALKNILPKEIYAEAERKYKEAIGNRNPCTTSNLERTTINRPLAKKKTARFNRPVRVRIVTVRKVKPRDNRAVSEKYVLDSIVSAGILQDDSQKFIPEEPIVECYAGLPEMTRIEIEEI